MRKFKVLNYYNIIMGMGVQMFEWGDIQQEIKSKAITSISNIQVFKMYNIYNVNKYQDAMYYAQKWFFMYVKVFMFEI